LLEFLKLIGPNELSVNGNGATVFGKIVDGRSFTGPDQKIYGRIRVASYCGIAEPNTSPR